MQGVLQSKKRQVQTFLIVFTQVAFRFIKRYLYVCRNEYIHKTLSLLVSFISLKSFSLFCFPEASLRICELIFSAPLPTVIHHSLLLTWIPI